MASGGPHAATSRARERARGRERDLLAQDGAHRGLGRVDGAGGAEARARGDQRGEHRVGGEDGAGGGRVGIEVEQVAAAGLGGREVDRIVECEDGLHVVRGRRERHDPGAAGQVERAAVHAVVQRLDARHQARGQPAQDARAVEGRTQGEAQGRGRGGHGRHRAGMTRAAAEA